MSFWTKPLSFNSKWSKRMRWKCHYAICIPAVMIYPDLLRSPHYVASYMPKTNLKSNRAFSSHPLFNRKQGPWQKTVFIIFCVNENISRFINRRLIYSPISVSSAPKKQLVGSEINVLSVKHQKTHLPPKKTQHSLLCRTWKKQWLPTLVRLELGM